MTKDEIMKMARDAGAPDPMVFIGAYERFAALVADAEREACAKVTEDPRQGLSAWRARENIAAAIRARSQK